MKPPKRWLSWRSLSMVFLLDDGDPPKVSSAEFTGSAAVARDEAPIDALHEGARRAAPQVHSSPRRRSPRPLPLLRKNRAAVEERLNRPYLLSPPVPSLAAGGCVQLMLAAEPSGAAHAPMLEPRRSKVVRPCT